MAANIIGKSETELFIPITLSPSKKAVTPEFPGFEVSVCILPNCLPLIIP